MLSNMKIIIIILFNSLRQAGYTVYTLYKTKYFVCVCVCDKLFINTLKDTQIKAEWVEHAMVKFYFFCTIFFLSHEQIYFHTFSTVFPVGND